mgnify:CR=1 FL=1
MKLMRSRLHALHGSAPHRHTSAKLPEAEPRHQHLVTRPLATWRPGDLDAAGDACADSGGLTTARWLPRATAPRRPAVERCTVTLLYYERMPRLFLHSGDLLATCWRPIGDHLFWRPGDWRPLRTGGWRPTYCWRLLLATSPPGEPPTNQGAGVEQEL